MELDDLNLPPRGIQPDDGEAQAAACSSMYSSRWWLVFEGECGAGDVAFSRSCFRVHAALNQVATAAPYGG